MKKPSRSVTIRLIVKMPDGQQKRDFIKSLLKEGQITEEEIAQAAVEDIAQNIDRYRDAFLSDEGLRFLFDRFKDWPEYLARVLVRVRPDIFYYYGFSFRLVLKLRADLGPIVIRPRQPGEEYTPSVYMDRLPAEVQPDVFAMDCECRFREHLLDMSCNAEDGLQLLDMEIDDTKDAYAKNVLSAVKEQCVRLRSMTFPDFVETLQGKPFPAFHVRWWLERAKDVPHSLNIGDTGTFKTSFGVMAMHHYGCRKTLVLCAPNARTQWGQEIQSYFKNPEGRVFVVYGINDLTGVIESDAEFIVVAYSTLIAPGVVDMLLRIPFQGLVWDECHYGNNLVQSSVSDPKGAQRAIACRTLIEKLQFRRICALSATPWQNHPMEFAAIAAALRPDVFATPDHFRQTRPEDPRFLREFLAANVLDVEAREVKHMPNITPRPWEDIFGAELIRTTPIHRSVYDFVREDEDVELEGAQKVSRLLLTAIHPHAVRDKHQWPTHLAPSFTHWRLSTKLGWLEERVRRKLAEGAKVVIGTGIFVESITKADDANHTIWVGDLLREWFGKSRVLILDGSVSNRRDRSGVSPRDRLIQQWKMDPEARILLVSMRTCPDSINLAVPPLPGITKLFLTALSYPWVPPKQFWGRFFGRTDNEVQEVEYDVPVLEGTIDESHLRLLQRKWRLQQLFRAQVALTEQEYGLLSQRIDLRRLGIMTYTQKQLVRYICKQVERKGELGADQVLSDGVAVTYAELLALAFIATQETSASGNIARFMEQVIRTLEDRGLLHLDYILDGGCGPLTLERILKHAIFSMDLNPHMIEIGRKNSPCGGVNARIGYLSQLPKEWTGKFELTVTSLVLDWTSLKARTDLDGWPERLRILRELVRVTHPTGRVWIAMTGRSMNEEILQAWVDALRAQKFTIVEELTGLIRSTDGQTNGSPFTFWSLCFAPNGQPLVHRTLPRNSPAYRFLFEVEGKKRKRGGRDVDPEPNEDQKVIHEQFEVVQLGSGVVEKAKVAAQQATEAEIERIVQLPAVGNWMFHRFPNIPWRALERLRKIGNSLVLKALGLG